MTMHCLDTAEAPCCTLGVSEPESRNTALTRQSSHVGNAKRHKQNVPRTEKIALPGVFDVCLNHVAYVWRRAPSPTSWGALGAARRHVGCCRDPHLRALFHAASAGQLEAGLDAAAVAAVAAHPPGKNLSQRVLTLRTEAAAAAGARWGNGFELDSSNRHTMSFKPVVDGGSGLVRALLQAGLSVNAKDRYDRSMLCWASLSGHESIIRELFEAGANLKKKANEEGSPLCLAIKVGQLGAVKVILDHLLGQDRCRWSDTVLVLGHALVSAADHGNLEAMRMLLSSWPVPDCSQLLDTRGKGQKTPLMEATYHGQDDAVQLLLDYKAHPDSGSAHLRGLTALHWASYSSRASAIVKLLDAGANLESRDKDSRTPLMVATKEGHESVVELLLARGASLSALDNSGRSPLGLAIVMEREVLVRMLLKAGAEITKECEVQASRCPNRSIQMILQSDWRLAET